MFMRIEENLFKKTITRNTTDPYFTSLEFMKQISSKGKVIEKENSYSTDGPFHRSEVVFEFVQHLDAYTSMKLAFFLMGENSTRNYLRMDVVASFSTNIEENGFFTEFFAEFYLENVFPIMKKTAESRIKNMLSFSEDVMAQV
jgi:hypothetical protein